MYPGLSTGISLLYPEYRELKVATAIHEDIRLPSEGKSDSSLPFTFINMVSSVDGKVSVSGRSDSIGSTVDRATMRELRSKADAIMIGSGTVRAERVSLTSEGKRTPEPLAIIVSSSLDIPLEENLLDSERERTLVLTTGRSLERNLDRAAELEKKAQLISCNMAGKSEEIDFRDTLKLLRTEHGIDRLLVEGGPSLNHKLVSSGMIDELFLTFSPQILGGEPENSLNIVSGPFLDIPVKPSLISIHLSQIEDENTTPRQEIFFRYSLRG